MTTDIVEQDRRNADAASSLAKRRSWLRWAARVGYAACGVVYIATGAIAAAVVFGWAERPRGAHRALVLIERQPLGEVLLAALSVGFLGYAALNIAGALRDPEQRGRSIHAFLMRAADVVTGAIYVALAVAAVRVAAAPSRAGGRVVETWVGGVLNLPFGPWMLGSVGLALLGAGGFLVYRARMEPFEDIFDRRSLSPRARRLLAQSARFGTLVRGVVLGISGMLVLEAAVTRRPERVGGVGDALSTLQTTPAGALLLAIAALGFIAYGIYQFGKVRYRRVSIG